MAVPEKPQKPAALARAFAKWALLGTLMGVVGGLLGTAFHYALHFVTGLRGAYTWLVLLLPLGGLLTVAIYKLVPGNRGTNEVIDAVLEKKHLNPLIAPVIFLSTAITHLFGGSAGREGAALQLGGSVASLLGKAFHLDDEDRTILVTAGMSAVFAGLFRTPLTAAVFCLEFSAVGSIFAPALLPCYLSAFTASQIAGALGVHAEGHIITTYYNLSPGWALSCALLAVLVALLGILMCKVFHTVEHLAQHHIKSPWIRVWAGGVLIAAMTMLVGDHRFNGAGMDMALGAVHGQGEWYYFLVKMLFTAVTLAAGFKGGEIVPTFCIGSTFGLLVGNLIGMDAEIAAALGLVGLFCSVTNAPLAAILLSVEMFGSINLPLFALVCVVCYLLSGHSSLYASQQILHPKDFGNS